MGRNNQMTTTGGGGGGGTSPSSETAVAGVENAAAGDASSLVKNAANTTTTALSEKTTALSEKADDVRGAVVANLTSGLVGEIPVAATKTIREIALSGTAKALTLTKLYSMSTVSLVCKGIGYVLKALLNLTLAPFFLVLIPLYFHVKFCAFYWVVFRELFSQPPEGMFC